MVFLPLTRCPVGPGNAHVRQSRPPVQLQTCQPEHWCKSSANRRSCSCRTRYLAALSAPRPARYRNFGAASSRVWRYRLHRSACTLTKTAGQAKIMRARQFRVLLLVDITTPSREFTHTKINQINKLQLLPYIYCGVTGKYAFQNCCRAIFILVARISSPRSSCSA